MMKARYAILVVILASFAMVLSSKAIVGTSESSSNRTHRGHGGTPADGEELPPITIEQLAHSSHARVGQNSFSTTTTFLDNRQTVSIRADNGDTIEVGQTSDPNDALTIIAADKDNKSINLTLTAISDNLLDAVLQMGGKCFSAEGSGSGGVLDDLFGQINPDDLPDVSGIDPLTTAMDSNSTMAEFVVGRKKPDRSKRKTTCQAVCDCCAKDGDVKTTAMCCGACSVCDYLGKKLTDEVNPQFIP
jgi:hypothetical protein